MQVLEPPKTIREVAEMAGWSYDRMKTFLLRIHAESGGMLLIASAGCRRCKGRHADCPAPHVTNRRYTVKLSVLRRLAPHLVASTVPTSDAVNERVTRLETVLHNVAEARSLARMLVPVIDRDVHTGVYFIRSNAPTDVVIKVGWAADAFARVAQLQTAHPWSLDLLAVAAVKRTEEVSYHRRFMPHRVGTSTSREWFWPAPPIVKEICRLQSLAQENAHAAS